ncbi:MAG: GNAT family N-acetyltransferase [Clostridia bacterium]|nr:GNAT family N-acetyltransferase [Clostridia bacterium]
MRIRKAEAGDIPAVLRLLSQVLEIHARIRPDVFIPGSTKYTADELLSIFKDEKTPVFVADDGGTVVGYVFCAVREPQFRNTMRPRKTLFIDDLCVEEARRGERIGETLFRFVRDEAERLGCGDVTLCVWEGNDGAKRFYERMGMRPKETMMELAVE